MIKKRLVHGATMKQYPPVGDTVKTGFYFGGRYIESGSKIVMNKETTDFGFIGWKDTHGEVHIAKE